jgi:hypothetical protein
MQNRAKALITVPAALCALTLLFGTSHARAQEATIVSSTSDYTGRYEMIAIPNGKEPATFRFDHICGTLEVLNTEAPQPGWKVVSLPGMAPCVLDGRGHYQLLSPGQGHAYLMNVDNKATWDLDLTRLAPTQM